MMAMRKSRFGACAVATAAGVTLATAAAGQSLVYDFDDGENPFGVGEVVSDRSVSGDYSLRLDPSLGVTIAVPTELQGEAVRVTMQVFDQGLWIDREVEGWPANLGGGRWGLGTDGASGGSNMGITFANRATWLSSTGYAYLPAPSEEPAINHAWNDWWGTMHWAGISRQVEELGDGGSWDDVAEQWVAPQPGVGRWTNWIMDADADGNVAIYLEGTDPEDGVTGNIGGPVDTVYLLGGWHAELGELWFDDITIAALEPDVLVGDMNFDGVVDTGDVAPFVLALTDAAAYQSQFEVDEATMIAAGDVNNDGAFDTGDVAPFVQMLVGGGAANVPEPGSLALLGLGGVLLLRRRRAA